MTTIHDIASHPRPPAVPLPRWRILREMRQFHTASERFRDLAGGVTIVRLVPAWLSPPFVWVASPQGVHDVLTAPRGVIDKRTTTHRQLQYIAGENLFDLDDAPWQPRRRALQPVFTKQRVHSYGGEMAAAATGVAEGWADGVTVDLDREARHVTIDALARSVLGCRLDHLDELSRDVRAVIEHAADRGMRPLNPPHWLPTPGHRTAYAAVGRVRELGRGIVERCRQDPDAEAPLVHVLLAARDPDTGEALTDEQIVDELVAFLVAGQDTTATLLAYSLWALGHRPQMQERIREEVSACGTGCLTPDDIDGLEYTVQVLHEALRLCPPAPAVARTAIRDLVVDGFRVEAGSILITSFYALHRDPALWEEPLTFDPERFGPDRRRSIDRWQYLPFGAGRRSCVGDHFAMLEAAIGLASIVRDVDVVSAGPEFPTTTPFTLVADGPIEARVRRR